MTDWLDAEAAAVAGVPGEELAAAAGPLGIDDDEFLSRRLLGEEGHPLGVLRVSAASVHDDGERNARLAAFHLERHTNHVTPVDSVVPERLPLRARIGPRTRDEGAEQDREG